MSDKNLTLMNRLAVTLSASNVRSAQCTFSQVRHFAPTARTTTVTCSGVSIVVSSRASNAGKIAPATTAPTISTSAGDTPTTLHQVRPHLTDREVVMGR